MCPDLLCQLQEALFQSEGRGCFAIVLSSGQWMPLISYNPFKFNNAIIL